MYNEKLDPSDLNKNITPTKRIGQKYPEHGARTEKRANGREQKKENTR